MSANTISDKNQDRRRLIAPKGFHQSDFEEAWKRYVAGSLKAATAATFPLSRVAIVATVAVFRKRRKDGVSRSLQSRYGRYVPVLIGDCAET
jgi:hypothetical protein